MLVGLTLFRAALGSALKGGTVPVLWVSLVGLAFVFGYGKGRVDAAATCRAADQQRVATTQAENLRALERQLEAANQSRQRAAVRAIRDADRLRLAEEKANEFTLSLEGRDVACPLSPDDAERLRAIGG